MIESPSGMAPMTIRTNERFKPVRDATTTSLCIRNIRTMTRTMMVRKYVDGNRTSGNIR